MFSALGVGALPFLALVPLMHGNFGHFFLAGGFGLAGVECRCLGLFPVGSPGSRPAGWARVVLQWAMILSLSLVVVGLFVGASVFAGCPWVGWRTRRTMAFCSS